ncbi:hypothetical protein ASPVEDRAFT_36485 [Aspergillus versicolor CBS 583.65]|uniref:Uncharacterized protein n=1 Tax=Aspergillus versicolor CBS 583.65 TaxID=1036611 RepID=A0A1L9P6E4_ASPVE|nr:uncharacterized protein ASPVEDRAFT_36485 [Aspergillus versicolor CBS 583.65]OJI97091.1 hypothetical protein ASPVEDRAFT_36485 [Aspergillus versicolor CBS 583.65]
MPALDWEFEIPVGHRRSLSTSDATGDRRLSTTQHVLRSQGRTSSRRSPLNSGPTLVSFSARALDIIFILCLARTSVFCRFVTVPSGHGAPRQIDEASKDLTKRTVIFESVSCNRCTEIFMHEQSSDIILIETRGGLLCYWYTVISMRQVDSP